MVTETRGAFAMLAALTAFWNARRPAPLIAYLLGCAVAPAALLAYATWNQSLFAAYDDVIRFAAERYASIQGVPFCFQCDFTDIPLLGIFPLTAVLLLLVIAADGRACLRDHRLRVSAAFALAGFAGCYPRPNFAHIAAASPLAFPLLSYCITRLLRGWRPTTRYWLAADMFALSIPKALAYGAFIVITLRADIVATPRGEVKFIGLPGAPQMVARIVASPPGDRYFFYPFMMMMPYLSGRQQVSGFDLFQPYYTLPIQYLDACHSVLRQASWVVLDRGDSGNMKLSFPLMGDRLPVETVTFERILDSAFELVSQEGTLEMRRRKDGVDDRICDDIAK